MGSEVGVTPDSKPSIVLDGVSIWWACWACIWTAAVVAGMTFLIIRRNSPTLRFRGIYLSLSSIVLLHLYWIAVQFGYMLGPLMPGDAQYWIMGTYLPCGIALFHASNSRFLHVAKLQKKYAHRDSNFIDHQKNGNGWTARFRRLDYDIRILIIVGIGMVFQVRLWPSGRSALLCISNTARCLGFPYVSNVDYLSEVAQFLGYPWHCCAWSYNGAEDGAGSRMGVVSPQYGFYLIMTDVE